MNSKERLFQTLNGGFTFKLVTFGLKVNVQLLLSPSFQLVPVPNSETFDRIRRSPVHIRNMEGSYSITRWSLDNNQ